MDILKPARIHSANTISVMADDASMLYSEIEFGLSSSIKRDIVIETKKLQCSPPSYIVTLFSIDAQCIYER